MRFLVCRRQCEFQRAEDDILGNVLFTCQRIDQQQNFTAHSFPNLLLPSSVELGDQPGTFDVAQIQFCLARFEDETYLAVLQTLQDTIEIAPTVVGNAQL